VVSGRFKESLTMNYVHTKFSDEYLSLCAYPVHTPEIWAMWEVEKRGLAHVQGVKQAEFFGTVVGSIEGTWWIFRVLNSGGKCLC
jgi:hypothetical protein